MVSYNIEYVKDILNDVHMRQTILSHKNCNQELIDALQGWETSKNIPGYLDYIATFSEELEKLQETIREEKNIQGKVEPYNQISSDDAGEEQDEDAPWSTPKILHYRKEILAGKFYSSDEYEDFLYELFAAERKFIDKGAASIETPQEWYESCLNVIDIVLNYHQTPVLYTLAGEYKLYVLENYHHKYKIKIDPQKILQEVEGYYRASLQYTPIEIDTHYFAIHFFYVKKDYKRAIEYIHTNISLSPKDYTLIDSPELCSWIGYLGEFYYKTGQSTQARKYFEAMLELSDEYLLFLHTKEDAKSEIQRFISVQLYRYLSIAPAFGAEILETHYNKKYREEYLLYIADLYYDASMYEKAIDYYNKIEYTKDIAKCYEKIGDDIQAYTAYHIYIEALENHLSTDVDNKQYNEDILDACEKVYQITHKQYLQETGNDDGQDYRLNEIIFITEKVLRTIGFSQEWGNRLVDAYYDSDVINRYSKEDIYLDIHGRTGLAEKYIKNDDLKSALKACIYALKAMKYTKNTLNISDRNIPSSPKLSDVLDICIQKAEQKKLNDVAQQGRDIKNLLQDREK